MDKVPYFILNMEGEGSKKEEYACVLNLGERVQRAKMYGNVYSNRGGGGGLKWMSMADFAYSKWRGGDQKKIEC